jgi:hypothetical protein
MSDWTPIPQNGDWELVDSLGKDLSAILHCQVRYCSAAYDKPVYECGCSKIFPKFAVQAAQTSGDWSAIMQRHNEKD